ncbi:MAG TPA: NUDIX domain-containing protein [Candidatus Paceibacterota bacterium]|jgi:8-oxo-dGTP pyrophosphatase MutT (NUDIX family)
MTPPQPANNELHRVVLTGTIWRLNSSGRYEYLITKRSDKKIFPNKWHLPGGGMEASDYVNEEPSYKNAESPQWYYAVERALRREIREEVGLEIEDAKYLLDVAFIRPDGIPVVVLSYYCKYGSGEVTPDYEDTVDFRWITVDEVDDFDFIKGIEDEIRMVEERLTKQA